MNNRPTPETNSIIRNAQASDHPPTRLAATLTLKCEKLERERNEARDAIIGWENKWKCAIDMAARAELELDELKYSLKIRAINESLRYSKDKNENDNIISKLNSLNPFYKY